MVAEIVDVAEQVFEVCLEAVGVVHDAAVRLADGTGSASQKAGAPDHAFQLRQNGGGQKALIVGAGNHGITGLTPPANTALCPSGIPWKAEGMKGRGRAVGGKVTHGQPPVRKWRERRPGGQGRV